MDSKVLSILSFLFSREQAADFTEGLFWKTVSCILYFHPDSHIQTIRKTTFWECKSLAFLILLFCVSTIDDHAFYRCRSLQFVSFPQNLKRIGRQAFNFCDFPSPDLPDSLEIQESRAFFKCNNLEYVRLQQKAWIFHFMLVIT